MNWNKLFQETESDFENFDPEMAMEEISGELPRRRGQFRQSHVRKIPRSRNSFKRFPSPIRFPISPWPGVTVIRDRYGNEPDPGTDKPSREPGSSSGSLASGGTFPGSDDAMPERSEYVLWVQNTLNHFLGLRLPLDGMMGPETRSAVRNFQQRQGLPIDGIVGPETERALLTASRISPPRITSEFETFETELVDQEWEAEINRSSSDYIKWVQQSLNRIIGMRLAVDGISGTQTRSGIRNFQQKHGLIVDGIVGPQTEQALISAGAGNPPHAGGPSSSSPISGISTPSTPAGSYASMPPVEGPYKGVTGSLCADGKGKCWKSAVRDIIDSDAPWNDPSNRHPAHYAAVLDYLNVDNPNNYRFAPRVGPTGKKSTFCNIYAHDATRMMWASIPHWITDLSQPIGWNELGANRTFDWMRSNSRTIGWVQIDDRMCKWLREQFDRRQSVPFSDLSVPAKILIAGSEISALNHASPSLLSQPSYVAQQFANLGLPTVIIFKNPQAGRAGHLAMVRPESLNLRGQIYQRTGLFVPRSAQAGAKNFRNALANWITRFNSNSPYLMLYVHE